MNRTEINSLRNLAAASKSPADESTGKDEVLSNDEIKAKVDAADKNPGNFSYQKNLGIALYRYSAMKLDADLLATSLRILERAASLDDKDYDVTVNLGNAHFDTGFAKKDNAGFQKSAGTIRKSTPAKTR